MPSPKLKLNGLQKGEWGMGVAKWAWQQGDVKGQHQRLRRRRRCCCNNIPQMGHLRILKQRIKISE